MSATPRTSTGSVADPSCLGPARAWASSAAVLAAWLAAASTAMYAIYSVHGVVILCVVAVVVVAAVWFGVFRTFPPTVVVAVLALAVAAG